MTDVKKMMWNIHSIKYFQNWISYEWNIGAQRSLVIVKIVFGYENMEAMGIMATQGIMSHETSPI